MTESGDDFVREHEALVRRLAIRIRDQLALPTDVDELMAYGYRGLVEAQARFDPERGVKFTTFAYYRVRGAILDGVREMAYLPRRAHTRRKAAEALDRAAEEVAMNRAADPDARRDLRGTLDAVDAIIGRTCAAFVISVVGQAEGPFADPEEEIIEKETRGLLGTALEVLPERERALVVGYYVEDRTLDELGREMGMSKSWASRLCSRALLRMRAVLEEG